ncbi:aminotransferase class I/II-fold pyridoxal phosphate-dependent enzyme [Candidatus Parcubacteria bacterium]|jgi:perosamine synthetase|nr:aminotransferase class I/II-fold pyridoxal phosphate-dependent enzyme [Candidatus Parcubacteria bacterium]
MIFTGFLPNATTKDLLKSLDFLLLPWKWFSLRKGKGNKKVEKWLKTYFEIPHTYTFDSGRTALQKGLEVLGVQRGDEVLVQAYTCMVVSNAIKWAHGNPVYVDVGNDLNIDCADLEKKITNKSKVLIIQHTFGRPADLEKLLDIAKKHNLKVIEDCAHSLGVKHNGKFLGTSGDIGMFSFGTDKVVSSMRGGALITSDKIIGNKIKKLQQDLPLPKLLKTIQYLLAFPAFAIGKPLYEVGGRYFLGILKKLNILGRIMYDEEKKGNQVSFYPSQFANSFASILLNQLEKMDEVNRHRQKIADLYNEKITNKDIVLPEKNNESNYLRYALLVKNPLDMIVAAKKNGIMLGNWYDTVIAPGDCTLEASGYKKGSCPVAEKLSSQSINLPTNRHIDETKAQKIIDFVNSYGN